MDGTVPVRVWRFERLRRRREWTRSDVVRWDSQRWWSAQCRLYEVDSRYGTDAEFFFPMWAGYSARSLGWQARFGWRVSGGKSLPICFVKVVLVGRCSPGFLAMSAVLTWYRLRSVRCPPTQSGFFGIVFLSIPTQATGTTAGQEVIARLQQVATLTQPDFFSLPYFLILLIPPHPPCSPVKPHRSPVTGGCINLGSPCFISSVHMHTSSYQWNAERGLSFDCQVVYPDYACQ
ncbi:hypothetical protein BDN72DRAFT_376421 [Pluteus cervinus]|uniref:Uncharacterized protein n=1 Tax=Pluteus cervinus TaxID=181527 RepID=A0ACD3AAJ3_9AGAR|nr:hypothetical protein BDN72DRAFT_376421 [Pluteus cervinus]